MIKTQKQLSGKQKSALEILTGENCDKWSLEAALAYFHFTDTGESIDISENAQKDYQELLYRHRFHPVTVELWKQDFRKGLLSLNDFLLPDWELKDGESSLTRYYPDAYIQHAFEIFEAEMGFLPGIFREDYFMPEQGMMG